MKPKTSNERNDSSDERKSANDRFKHEPHELLSRIGLQDEYQ